MLQYTIGDKDAQEVKSLDTIRPMMSDEERADYLVVDHLRTEDEREIRFRQGTPVSFQQRIVDCFKKHGFQTEVSANRLLVKPGVPA